MKAVLLVSSLLLVAGCGEAGDNAQPANGVESVPLTERVPEVEPTPVAANAAADMVVANASVAAPEAPAPRPELSEAEVRAQYTPGLDACLNKDDAAKGVSVAMSACFQAELAIQDRRLNAAYKSALAKRDAAGQAALRDEERAWIKRRDADCQAEASGGSIDMVEIPACILNETIRRRVILQPMAG